MLLLIDKPTGITSQDAISAVKKNLRQPARDALSEEEKGQGIKPPKIKIGHAGTLDPMASGLLIAATDRDTKLLHHLAHHHKSYIATIDFSIITDTRDMDYRKEYTAISPILQKYAQSETKELGLSKINDCLKSIIGTHDLPLTPFSAKKVNGKKLYEYARAGKPIFLTIPMSIYHYEIIEYTFPRLTIQLHVGSGTYIRSIAHRLGTQLGLGGTLTMLRRIQIRNYTVDQIDQEHKTAIRDDKEVYYTII